MRPSWWFRSYVDWGPLRWRSYSNVVEKGCSEECESSVLVDACRLGLLQGESFTSRLEVKRVVTFPHKSFQEYCAAYYLVHLLQADRESFRSTLRRVDSDDLFDMEYLLRCCCGLSSSSSAVNCFVTSSKSLTSSTSRSSGWEICVVGCCCIWGWSKLYF